ncbi:hypothetical protein Stsp02_24750 [Streptomyces sp. NBRC 14336]|nr:hypothetical protein Stsp02_24750 [Streptomyces sp. NBRC 14336]
MAGVEGQIGGACLRHRQQGHDQSGGPGQGYGHQGFGARTLVTQSAGETVGAGVEFRVGQRLPAALDGDGVRGARGLLLAELHEVGYGGHAGSSGAGAARNGLSRRPVVSTAVVSRS